MLHSKHIYVIVVPHICCSKNPTTCTCFFSLVYCTSGPMSSDMVSKFTVSQWDHTSSKVGYHDHVWTVSSQREYESQSTLNPRLYDTLVTGVGGGPLLTPAHSARQDMCQDALYSKTYHTDSCQTSRVDLCVSFFCTVSPTAVGNQRRGCLLKQDMSAGEDANCCSGILSIGNLQGHTHWVFFWVPSRASSRLTA